MMTPPSRLRAGIIGISGYGRIHLGLAREVAADLELAAAVVINPEEEAENVRRLRASGCQIYDSYEAMLAAEHGRLDLCFIPTGIAWHTRMTLAAVRAGMNVLVEKPLAASVGEVHAIIGAAAAARRFVAVGFQDIYDPVAQAVKQRLLAGEIGRVQAVRLLGLWPRPPGYFTRNGWAGKLFADGAPVLDSPLSNAFAHFVNLGLFFAGRSFEAVASAHEIEAALWRTNAIESFDTGVLRAVTADGVRLWFGGSHACAVTREPEIVIEGDGGRVIWRHEQECVIERSGAPVERLPLFPTGASRRAMINAVLHRCTNPAAFVCTAEMSLQHTALIERVHQTGRIHFVPGASAELATAAGPVQVLAVPGIDSVLRAAFATGDLPGVPVRSAP